MAIITTTIVVSGSSFFSEGQTYTWTILKLDSPVTIDTFVDNITATTIDITYDGSLLPLGVAELSECNLQDPTLVLESCCDVFFYDAPDATALTDLPGAGVPIIAPLGRNILRVGSNPQMPNEVWEYDKTGDPQNLDNWYRIEILPYVVSDDTLTGDGSPGDPLGSVITDQPDSAPTSVADVSMFPTGNLPDYATFVEPDPTNLTHIFCKGIGWSTVTSVDPT
jgi:hypothetical protein